MSGLRTNPLVLLGVLFVLAAIAILLLRSEISERTFYTGEIYAWSAAVALVGVILAGAGLRSSRRGGREQAVAKVTVGIGGLIVIVVALAFAFAFLTYWLAYR